MVTVVVKLTTSFVRGGKMKLIDPDAVTVEDAHDGNNPTRPVVRPRELAPQLHRVDVLLKGHAQPKSPAATSKVRLAIANETATLLDKQLMVRGDPAPDGSLTPFTKMKLDWKRAYGGIGCADNPLGTGFGSATSSPPNIMPISGEDRTVGFGPIPHSFASRKKLLGSVPKKQISETIARIPASFDWGYFQAAPIDQQLEALRGDEWLMLDGFDPKLCPLRTRLPGAKALAKIYGHEQVGTPDTVPLTIDMVMIDTDAHKCAMVHRGSFPLMNEDALNAFVVAGSYELVDEPALWPESANDLDLEPYVPITSPNVRTAVPAIPRGLTTTAAMDTAANRKASGATLPFADGASEHQKAGDIPLTGTFVMGGDDDVSTMPISDAGQPRKTDGEIPGAPWAKVAARPVVAPVIGATTSPGEAKLSRRKKKDADDEARPTEAKAAEAKAAEAKAAEAKAAEAKAAEEGKAKERAALKAAEEAERAEQRRKQEAARFAEEQQAARQEAARRAIEEAGKKRDAAKNLQKNIYGSFKTKK